MNLQYSQSTAVELSYRTATLSLFQYQHESVFLFFLM